MKTDVHFPGTFGTICLGMLQILVWGGSFFLLAVMADPIRRDTGWGSQWVYGALSLSLMVSALLAPYSSRLVARYGGRIQLASSGAVVAMGLLIVSFSHSLLIFMLAWAVIGVGMAMGLYETLFSTLGSLYAEQAGKVIVGVTLISGFATTLSWPAVAYAIEILGWRYACVGYAVLLLIVVAPLYLRILPPAPPRDIKTSAILSSSQPVDRGVYLMLVWIFALGAVIMTAISVQLIALLQGLGHSLTAAIGLSALLGPSQVGSRVLQLFAGRRHPVWIALISAVLIVMGLLLVSVAPAATALGLILYGCGNGLRAIVRGLLPLVLMPQEQYVSLMGKMSRPSLIGQALTPMAGGFVIQHFGAMGVLVVLCALALIKVVLVLMVMQRLKALKQAV